MLERQSYVSTITKAMDFVSQNMFKYITEPSKNTPGKDPNLTIKLNLREQNEALLPWYLQRYIGNFTKNVCDQIDYFYVNVFHDPVYKIGRVLISFINVA